MLFDPRPKTSRKELYDREKELQVLEDFARKGSPLMVMLGIRRIGKTSLLRVFLHESGRPFIYIDARALEEQGFRREALYRMLSSELTRLRGKWTSLVEYLRILDGVEIGPALVRFDLVRSPPSLIEVFSRIDEWASDSGMSIIVAVDEAQLLRYLRGGKGRVDFTQVVSYAYDHLRNMRFVITGSEVGLLVDFLGFNNPKSWLYGRVRDDLIIARFDRDRSIDFLEEGFNECGVTYTRSVLEETVAKVDGIPGWLTYFGYHYCKNPSPEAVLQVFEEAKTLALDELRKLHSRYYALALKAIALGYSRWRNIKQALELWTGRSLTNAQVTRALKTLAKLGLIENVGGMYKILDPIIAEAAKEL